MRIDPASLARIEAAIAAGTCTVTGGAVPPPSDCGRVGERAAPETVTPAAEIAAVFVLPVVTASEANGRDWRARSGRTKSARAVVSKELARHLSVMAAFAAHYAAGGTLDVVLTRLGGRHLDDLANLGPALKATEDALCALLGANDADPRWDCRAEQRPGGPVGVRVELRARA